MNMCRYSVWGNRFEFVTLIGTSDRLTTLYKCTPRDRRGMIDKWAAEKYPDIWNPWRRADLERLRAREEAEAWREGIGNDL